MSSYPIDNPDPSIYDVPTTREIDETLAGGNKAQATARARLANNGRNTANSNAGIRVGSDLHLCEMLLADIDRMRLALRKFAIHADCYEGRPDGDPFSSTIARNRLTVGDLRKARAALLPKE